MVEKLKGLDVRSAFNRAAEIALVGQEPVWSDKDRTATYTTEIPFPDGGTVVFELTDQHTGPLGIRVTTTVRTYRRASDGSLIDDATVARSTVLRFGGKYSTPTSATETLNTLEANIAAVPLPKTPRARGRV